MENDWENFFRDAMANRGATAQNAHNMIETLGSFGRPFLCPEEKAPYG
jgi:hypothetical protein